MTSDRYWSRLAKLIDGLIATTPPDASGSGGRKWQKVGDHTYDLNLTRSTLRIESKDDDGNYPYLFSILDDDGQPIETLEDDGRNDFGQDWNLGTLYNLASRSHTGAETKLTEVMQELGFDADTTDPWAPSSKTALDDDEPPF